MRILREMWLIHGNNYLKLPISKHTHTYIYAYIHTYIHTYISS